MSDKETFDDNRSLHQCYEIRLEGHLDHRWDAWFEGLTISLEEDGTTVLSGSVPDQAALHGLLKRVRDLGLPLVSVSPLEDGPADQADATLADGNEVHPYGSEKETR